jgi:hypothetical protein
VTPMRAFIVAVAFALAVEAVIYFSLAALGASGDLAVAAEMIWLSVSVFLALAFIGRYEHEGSDDSGD